MRSRIAWTIVALVVVVLVAPLLSFDLTALNDPGRAEKFIANRATRFLIHRASQPRLRPRPADIEVSGASGGTHYAAQCGACHGFDGRSQTPIGRSMYPRASDLTSDQVQSFSDQELFWIIQNGIRFTGMPGFGKVETDGRIWQLVDYVRTLPGARTQ
jgi:mono/diheme cytochrome c family protein